MIRVRNLEDFLELVNKYRPVFLYVDVPLGIITSCKVVVSGFSKLDDRIAVKAEFNEECKNIKEECEEIVFDKIKRYLLNNFSKVYEGVITE